MKNKLIFLLLCINISHGNTLINYYNKALSENPSIKEYLYIYQSSKYKVDKIDSKNDINITWNANVKRNHDTSESELETNTYNENFAKATIQKALYNQENNLELKNAKIESKIQHLKYKKALEDFTIDFLKKYFDIIRTKKNILFSIKNKNFSERYYKKLSSLYEKNLVSELDYFKAKTNFEESKSIIILSKLEFKKSKQDFNLLLNINNSNIKIFNKLNISFLEQKINNFNSIFNNIELKVSELELQILKNRLKKKDFKFIPNIDFLVSYSHLDTQDPTTNNLSQASGQINISGTLYKGGFENAEKDEFKLLIKANNSRLNTKKNELKYMLNEQKYLFIKFLNQSNIIKKRLNEENLNLKILNRKNSIGFTDNSKVLESQSNIFKLESQITELSINALISYIDAYFIVSNNSKEIILDLEKIFK